MQVSFIIPLYNCLAHTQECLRTLRATLPTGLAHEIIFVDDASTDGTREWLQTLTTPCRVVLNEKNQGFASTCNRGAAAAQGQLLFFLNNDLILLPHWLEPILEAFEKFSLTGLVGNVQLNAATGLIDHTAIFFNHKGKPAHDTALPLRTRWLGQPDYRAVTALTGACCAIRRSLWQQLGGFDEVFKNGSEDIDLCLRARAAGMQNYVALHSVVRHHISASAGRNLSNEQNSFRLVCRWEDQVALLSAHDWSRQQIITLADQSKGFDYPQIAAALIYFLGWPTPPRPVRDGVARSMAIEQKRWRELLEGAVNAPEPTPNLI